MWTLHTLVVFVSSICAFKTGAIYLKILQALYYKGRKVNFAFIIQVSGIIVIQKMFSIHKTNYLNKLKGKFFKRKRVIC